MPKTLSDDPDKRRLQLFQNIYQNYHRWRALVEDEQLYFINVEGEEVYFYDLLVGLDRLPPRQRQAFELHVLLGHTEVETWERMQFKSNYTTLVGQYSMAALKSMIRYYDNTRAARP
jgi:hypothetical protein